MEHFSIVPPAAITRVLSSFDRKQLEGFVAVAIDLMDLVDGDPDAEHDPFNEGEPTFSAADRELVNRHGGGAGCSILDQDMCEDADRGEWVDEREPEPYCDGGGIGLA